MTAAPPSPASRRLPFAAQDLRGLTQLAVDGVMGVAGVVEEMHHTIAQRAGLRWLAPSAQPRGVTGAVYRGVRATARLTGRCLDSLWALGPAGAPARQPQREAWVAALNGVWGDHLAASANPLAIGMRLHVAAPPTGRIVVLAHGLAMNDLQWTRQGHDHGQALARDAGFTPVYLHYNSGLHVSHNGRELSAQLDALIAQWPVPVRELVIVGHSMGGLVARSACHVGAAQPWRRHLTALVCLGTPHHGAPLERTGRWVDGLLGISAYAAPLARVGQARSAGITDLRFGNVQDADWQRHASRHQQTRDDRVPTPLPRGVKCFVVAATKARDAQGLKSAAIGDGLVPMASALGEHRDGRLALRVPRTRRFVMTEANHWDLLSDARVYAQLLRWLGDERESRKAASPR
jgi:alpha-beta hydrolase superfamily lysophospholipase